MKCLGYHENKFTHFDSGISEMADYDLGIKLRDTEPPDQVLYLYVSVKELQSQRDFGSIHYARSRTYLRDGFPSSQADRERLQADVIARLRDDVNALVNGKLKSSEENPIFIKPSTELRAKIGS